LNENIVFRFKNYSAFSFLSFRIIYRAYCAASCHTHRPPHKFFGKTKPKNRGKKEKKKAHFSGKRNGLVKVFAKKKLLRNVIFKLSKKQDGEQRVKGFAAYNFYFAKPVGLDLY
jgi:hypothetical protein